MEIKQILSDKKRFLDLLLLGDEQESMIDRYLERGDLFVLLEAGKPVVVCVVTDEGGQTYEIKNIATAPAFQRQGYGRRMIEYVAGHYADRCRTLLVGTGDVPTTVGFYERCGFTVSHRVAGFFTEHYDHPIFEDGRQLVDMVYLKRLL